MVLLYIVIFLVAMIGAVVLYRTLKTKVSKEHASAWFLLAFGTAFVLLFAFEQENQVFVLSIGLMCWIVGIIAFVRGFRQGIDAGPPP